MVNTDALEKKHEPDGKGFVDTILRKGTPRRAHHIELFHDGEIVEAICQRFGLNAGIDRDVRFWWERQHIALYRFLGFDYIQIGLGGLDVPLHQRAIEDTAGLKRAGGRTYLNEQTGPIATWEDFEKFPWPEQDAPAATEALEWCCENVPEDMCLVGMCGGHFAEWLTWLMGYESLCFALYDKRDLVDAIAARLIDIFTRSARRVAKFDRVKVLWGSDDMGFKTQPLISPADARA